MARTEIRKTAGLLRPLQSNARYLNALAQVEDPSRGARALDSITARRMVTGSRPVEPFEPLSRLDTRLFDTLIRGEDAAHRFNLQELRTKLDTSAFLLTDDRRKRSARVSRLRQPLHAFRLVAKISRSRSWRVTDFGWRVMSAALQLRYRASP